jgi:NTP pyrophosphatase (non-canonical NTP hydrolase)
MIFMCDKLKEIRQKLIEFRDLRNWNQFHDPKNLAEAISIEASELLEIFLWKSTDASQDPSLVELKHIREEVSDIFIYSIYLCEVLNIDILDAVENKIQFNEKKYPIELAKRSNNKW